MKKYSVFFALIAVTFFYACKPEIDINDRSKDVTICYLLLNPNESVNYAKIYKGFLYNNSLLEAASEEDNLYYFDSIEVSLKEYVGEHLRRILPMNMTDEIPKDEGLFSNPTQIVYELRDTLNYNAEYELVIKNKYSGAVKTAKTKIVGDLDIKSLGDVIIHRSTKLRFNNPANLAALDVYMIFHYIEVSKNTHQIVNRGHVRYHLSNTFFKPAGSNASGEIEYNINPSGIYKHLAKVLQPNPDIVRYKDSVFCVEYEVWGCAEDLLTYIESNTSSSSIISDKNIYTNFESEDHTAYGIFSSRNVQREFFDLIKASQDSLVWGSWTRHLGFRPYSEYLRN
jgi:hypothetical protein